MFFFLGLAIYDMSFVMVLIIGRSIPHLFSENNLAFKIIYPLMYPMGQITQAGSNFMIVLLSFERYLTVYRMKIISIKRTIYYMGVLTIFAILSNIPSMLIFRWEKPVDKIIATQTDISCNNDFIKHYKDYVLNLTLRFLLPTIALVGFNILIIKKVIYLFSNQVHKNMQFL